MASYIDSLYNVSYNLAISSKPVKAIMKREKGQNTKSSTLCPQFYSRGAGSKPDQLSRLSVYNYLLPPNTLKTLKAIIKKIKGTN